jgi:hypothetical protein
MYQSWLRWKESDFEGRIDRDSKAVRVCPYKIDACVEAVRELTTRIAAALAGVTLNLDSWEDEPLVSTAVRVWEAERAVVPDAAERAARLAITPYTCPLPADLAPPLQPRPAGL